MAMVHPSRPYGNFSVLYDVTSEMSSDDKVIVQKSRRCFGRPHLAVGIILAGLTIIATTLLVYFVVRTCIAETRLKELGSTTGRSELGGEPVCSKIDTPEGFRLPTALVPNLYKLTIKSYLPLSIQSQAIDDADNRLFTFEGNVTIIMNCTADTDKVVLNTNNLNFSDHFTLEEMDSIGVVKTDLQTGVPQVDRTRQTVVFNTAEKLTAGRTYSLTVSYVGDINQKLAGYYRTKYKADGQDEYMSITQFEVSEARQALPCFDEPGFKARFELSLVHDSNKQGVSNMKVIAQEDLGDGWTKTSFDVSPPMSTYLLAFSVNSMSFIEKTSNSQEQTKIRVYADPALINTTQYALEAGASVLEFYERFFNIPFPLGKLDLMALPDLDAGAMENWGLITYRETTLLYDSRPGTFFSLANKKHVALTIAHETAHQWFGNLVTMKWWDDLWLNEGFATYIEYIGMDHILGRKEQMLSQFVTDVVQSAMQRDQMLTTHPIRNEFKNLEDIVSAFDSISYEKGAAIIRMLNYTIGEGIFREGLNYYLDAFKYKNTDHNDLWNSFDLAIKNKGLRDWDQKGFNVKDFVYPWILQGGFPLVTVSCASDVSSCSLSQERFLLLSSSSSSPPKLPDSQFGYKWPVPIWYQTKISGLSDMIWLKPEGGDQLPLPQGFIKGKHWLVVNPESPGFFRTQYDQDNWRLLSEQLQENFTVFTDVTRAMLIGDSFTLAQAGRLPYELALNISTYLVDEQSEIPWASFIGPLGFLIENLIFTKDYGYIKAYMNVLFGKLYNAFGWAPKGDHKDLILGEALHSTIVGFACFFEVEKCISDATEEFHKLKSSCAVKPNQTTTCDIRIPPVLRSVVYCEGVRRGTVSDWQYLWDYYLSDPVIAEKNNILAGLSCTREPWLLSRLLDEAVFGKVLRLTEASAVFSHVAEKPTGASIAWQVFQANWKRIFDKFSGFSLSGFAHSLRYGRNTKFQVDQLSEFVDAHSCQLGTARQDFLLAVERSNQNMEWMRLHYDDIVNWFKARVNQ